MVTLYRAGGLPSVEELKNSNAVWFDSLSSKYIGKDGHVPRSDSVFMSLRPEDAFMWAERRIYEGGDGTIYEVEVPDEFPLNAYLYRIYDDAVRAFESPEDYSLPFQDSVDLYWIWGVTVEHYREGYMRCWEAYDDTQQWEIKVPRAVAAVSEWTPTFTHDFLIGHLNITVDYIQKKVSTS